MGALIWLHQTRPDIGYDIAKLATDFVAVCTDPILARSAINMYNKTVRFACNCPRRVNYADRAGFGTDAAARAHHLQQRRLVLLADAVFGSLADSRSVEGAVTALAQVAARDGIIHCHVYLLDRRCGKIQRARKSSLAAEAHAALAVADQALWFHVLLAEIVTGKYDISDVSPPTTYPHPDPFGSSPTDREVSDQMQAAQIRTQTHFLRRPQCQVTENSHSFMPIPRQEWDLRPTDWAGRLRGNTRNIFPTFASH